MSALNCDVKIRVESWLFKRLQRIIYYTVYIGEIDSVQCSVTFPPPARFFMRC